MEKVLEIIKSIVSSEYFKVFMKYLIAMVPIVSFHELGHFLAANSVKGISVNEVELGWKGIPLRFRIKDKLLTIRIPFLICGKTKCDYYLDGDRYQNWKLLWVSIAGPLFQFLWLVLSMILTSMTSGALYQFGIFSAEVNLLTLIIQLLPLKKFNTDGFKVVGCLWYQLKGKGAYDDQPLKYMRSLNPYK